jgi:lipoprotein-releasing system permease protein
MVADEKGRRFSVKKENRNTPKNAKFMPLLHIAIRWSTAKKKTSHQTGLQFAILGIAAGIVALIVVLSVMNGFQRQYIDSLLETTSFHVRITPENSDIQTLSQFLRQTPLVRSVTPFVETSLLAEGAENRQNVVRVMWIKPQDLARDAGFCKTLHIPAPLAEKSLENGILLGSEAARLLGTYEGTKLILRGALVSPDEGIQQYEIDAPVSGLFRSGYYELDAGLAILSQEKITSLPTAPAPLVLGVKLKKSEQTDALVAALAHTEGIKSIESWRDYNRSFFSALRTEKIVMFLLVSIIFAVVAINIHYSMRRTIARKARDLAILSAFGTSQRSISTIFMLEGLIVGIAGAALGVGIGIPVAHNVDSIINGVISLLESVISLFYRMGIAKSIPDLRPFSPSVFYIDGIPSNVFASDIALISAFAIIFPAIAVYLAYRRFKNASPLEVLRSE